MAVLEHGAAAPHQVAATVLKRVLFGFLALLTLATLYVHEGYVLRPTDPQWAHLFPFRWWLIPHVAGGATALVLGPLQFSTAFRRRWPALHRWLGRVYAVAVIVASSLSLYIVLTFEAPVNHWVMGVMGGLWLATTLFAWAAARSRNFAQHVLWMARSYGLTFTFVTTRFIPDVIFPGLDYYGTTALYWVLIVLSLLLPDILLNGRALWPVPARRRHAPPSAS
jgi:uncharacterized membrane protein